jgi:phosphoglycolate phosphatase
MFRYKNIIWDWNGTLLNDVDVCVDAMNILLKNRNMHQLSRKEYKKVFTFPVKEYYKAVGFDFNKEKFEKPAIEFIDNYNNLCYNVKLYKGVTELLKKIDNINIEQYILSAMEHKSLIKMVDSFGISSFFKKISGIDNYYAQSKIEQGKQLISDLNLDKKKTVIIGDTVHDAEVADILGVDCILVAHGHQSYERLAECGNFVIDSLKELDNFI